MTEKAALFLIPGIGVRMMNEGNLFNQTFTPNFDALFASSTFSRLAVKGDEPVSAHKNAYMLGTGRTYYSPSEQIDRAIKDGTFYTSFSLIRAIERARKRKKKVHVLFLLSNTGTYASFSHLIAFLKMAKLYDLKENQLYVHVILDGGKDQTISASSFIDVLKERLRKEHMGLLVSMAGRAYAFDRRYRFDVLEKTYESLVENKGNSYIDEQDYLHSEYEKMLYGSGQVSDAYVAPAYLRGFDSRINEDDSLVFLNYNPEFSVELATLLTNPAYYEHPKTNRDGSYLFRPYSPKTKLKNLTAVTLFPYGPSVLARSAFVPEEPPPGLVSTLLSQGRSVLSVGEEMKFPELMRTFNGGKDIVHENYLQVSVPTKKAKYFKDIPEMSVEEVSERCKEETVKKDYSFVVVCYTNVAVMSALKRPLEISKAISAVDRELGKMVPFFKERGYRVLFLSPYGRSESRPPNGTPYPDSPLPFLSSGELPHLYSEGNLTDFAPSVLYLMGCKIPPGMEGTSLYRPEEK